MNGEQQVEQKVDVPLDASMEEWQKMFPTADPNDRPQKMEPDKNAHFLETLRQFRVAVARRYVQEERLKRFKYDSKGWHKTCQKTEEYGLEALQAEITLKYLVRQWSLRKFKEEISEQYITFMNCLKYLETALAFKNRLITRMSMYAYKERTTNWQALHDEIEQYDLQIANLEVDIQTLLGYLPNNRKDDPIDL